MKPIVIFIAFFVRLAFIAYGTIHDRIMEVKFTDIDYTVFTAAAEHVTNKESPYLKLTYKYTPLLAYMLTPNILLHQLFGKVLFCIFDVIVVLILDVLLKKIKYSSSDLSNVLIITCWLYNPFTMTISSRGNAESFQILLVLLSLLFVTTQRLVLAGIFYGLSVHFKLYPIIYSVPFLMFIGAKGKQVIKESISKTINNILRSIFSVDNILFGTTSLVVFGLLGCSMYYVYGMEFIENTYLFHISRKDVQHNFSPYFYIQRIIQELEWGGTIKILAFVPQMVAVLLLGLKYYEQLPLACFLQTFAFVSLNKVCTSQYFVWYIGLFPLAYPYIRIPLKHVFMMITSWLGGQGIWLFIAYLLEFRKYNVAVFVWLASILFLVINMVLLHQFCKYANDNIQLEGGNKTATKDD